MKTIYTITENKTYNSREITFEGKPSEAVRTALKGLKLRWHGQKKCWYGFATESQIIAAICAAEQDAPAEDGAAVYTDGYMGGGAVYGSKSGKPLYGADLSAAIRADLKQAGIKGVTVRCKSYSGGQNITATVRATESMLVSRANYVAAYRITGRCAWIYTADCGAIHIDKYFAANAAERERIRTAAAEYAYDCLLRRGTVEVNQYRIDSNDYLTASGLELLRRVDAIIRAYRYDESNSMVDYFDTNFYYDLEIKLPATCPAA